MTEFKLGYHGTVLGFLWSLIRPLLLFAVLSSSSPRSSGSATASRLSGAAAVQRDAVRRLPGGDDGRRQSVVSNESVVRKMQFPRLVIPLSVVVTPLIQFALNLVVVL